MLSRMFLSWAWLLFTVTAIKLTACLYIDALKNHFIRLLIITTPLLTGSWWVWNTNSFRQLVPELADKLSTPPNGLGFHSIPSPNNSATPFCATDSDGCCGPISLLLSRTLYMSPFGGEWGFGLRSVPSSDRNRLSVFVSLAIYTHSLEKGCNYGTLLLVGKKRTLY